jgi:hypothetical protein
MGADSSKTTSMQFFKRVNIACGLLLLVALVLGALAVGIAGWSN